MAFDTVTVLSSAAFPQTFLESTDAVTWEVGPMTKKGEAAARRNYRTELICEILTREPSPKCVRQEMQWGIEQEPFARAAYELSRDILVETVGFVYHPDIARFGCSPDGLVDEDGLIQIKCPTTATHLSWMLAGTVPVEHMPQMIAEMACTGRAWCDFVSYDPGLPKHLQLFVRRYERDEKLISALEAEVVHFSAEIQQVLGSLPECGQPVVLSIDQTDSEEVEL